MFAHESEEKFADVLDELDLVWEYEPTVFVLKELDGNIKKALRPDFYVPELDMYIEISTCSNKRRKKRKIEMAQEMYPDAKIVLVLREQLNRIFADYSYLWSEA